MTQTPAFARGVRFRRLADGSAVLLVPEGVVTLSQSAGAIAELVDGSRSVDEIGAALCARFDAPAATIAADIRELLDRFTAKGWLAAAPPGAP